MYEVFDEFLNTPTWFTNHPRDEERFYQALHRVITKPDFQPDDMGEYFSQQVSEGKRVSARKQEAIEKYVAMAETILDYLHSTAGIRLME